MVNTHSPTPLPHHIPSTPSIHPILSCIQDYNTTLHSPHLLHGVHKIFTIRYNTVGLTGEIEMTHTTSEFSAFRTAQSINSTYFCTCSCFLPPFCSLFPHNSPPSALPYPRVHSVNIITSVQIGRSDTSFHPQTTLLLFRNSSYSNGGDKQSKVIRLPRRID